MKFRNLDLNLLVALNALLTEKNVSLAGKRIHLRQSAMSGALNRLRKYFNDELLVNAGRGMVLTPRAEMLIEPVRIALLHIETTIASPPELTFEPETTRRTFLITASDGMIESFLAPALAQPEMSGKQLTFEISLANEHAVENLERGQTDLLIVQEPYESPLHPKKVLFTDEYVVVACKSNRKIGATISKQAFLQATHVAVHPSGARAAPWEELVFQRFKQRHAAVVAPDASSVPHFLIGTERIATMRRRYAESYAQRLPLKILRCPLPIAKVREVMQWQAMRHDDPGRLWLVKMLHRFAARSGHR